MSGDCRWNPGDRIRLVKMFSDPYPIRTGETGTVTKVLHHTPPLPASRSLWLEKYPLRTGLPAPAIRNTVHVEWDSGRSLAVLLPADEIQRELTPTRTYDWLNR